MTDTAGVAVVVGGNDGSRSIMTSFPRKRESITTSHDVIPTEAGIRYGQRIPKLEWVSMLRLAD